MRKISKAYAQQSLNATDKLNASLESFFPLVRRIASQILSKLPSHIQMDDLVQAGYEGLLQARSRFDNTAGASFETFAGTRIRGAILDYLRQEDLLPKRERALVKKIETAFQQLRAQLATEPTELQVAQHLNMTLEQLREALQLLNHQWISVEDMGFDDSTDFFEQLADPNDLVEKVIIKDQLTKICGFLEKLNDNERLVLSLYHEKELTFKEIGSIIQLSEARVCQIYAGALLHLRSFFSDQNSSK